VLDDPRSDAIDPAGLLTRLADALGGADDLDTTLRSLVDTALQLTGASAGAVFLQDPDRVGMEPAVAVGIDEGPWARLADGLGVDNDPLAATARDRTPRRVPAGGDAADPFLTATGASRAAYEPLVMSRGGIDQALGVMALGWPSDAGSGASAGAGLDSLIAALARLASVAVDHARLASLVAERSEWFERVAQADPLTGLANERAFARVLEVELARAARQGSQVSLALFDVDGFVELNERAGHEAGDDVLRGVAAVLNESVRIVDTVARIGGDEFVVLAPGSAGSTLAQRAIEGVAALPDTGGRRVSISAGVARFPTDGATAGEVLDAAAAALADAKAGGPSTLRESGGQPAI
jgi:diguanylate cyclase (GGDEF)-like protein